MSPLSPQPLLLLQRCWFSFIIEEALPLLIRSLILGVHLGITFRLRVSISHAWWPLSLSPCLCVSSDSLSLSFRNKRIDGQTLKTLSLSLSLSSTHKQTNAYAHTHTHTHTILSWFDLIWYWSSLSARERSPFYGGILSHPYISSMNKQSSQKENYFK